MQKIHESTVAGVNYKLFDMHNDQIVDGIQNIKVTENCVSVSMFANRIRTESQIEHDIRCTLHLNHDQFIAMVDNLHAEAMRLRLTKPDYLESHVA